MKPLTAKSLIDKDLTTVLKGKSGYLPCQMIELACHQGAITSESSLLSSQFQPVSLDLRLGRIAYRIRCSFLPENDTVEERIKDLKLYEFSLVEGGILEKETVYLIPLKEELDLPPNIYGHTNPKSSIGRLDIFTRVITDRGHRFDEIPRGYKGKLYLEVIPRSFPVKVKENLSLNQLRLGFGPQIFFGKKSLEPNYIRYPILFDRSGFVIKFNSINFDGGFYISIDLAGGDENAIIAYKAKAHTGVIDLSKINHYEPLDFWEPIYRQKNNRLILDPEAFYIMMSKEKICVWPHLLGEMVAYEPNSGELRTHYAGFFDPGFGWKGSNEIFGQGAHAVMEVRAHDAPFMIEDGQTFCRLNFGKIIERPDREYGQNIASHYHSQELALSKYFKSPSVRGILK